MTKTKRKTKSVPLNKMTRKQLLSQLRKVKGKHTADLMAAHQTRVAEQEKRSAMLQEMQKLMNERDDFRQSLNGALEEIVALKGKSAVQALI